MPTYAQISSCKFILKLLRHVSLLIHHLQGVSCLLGTTAMWLDWPGEGARPEWHGFLGLSHSTCVSQCVQSVLCMGWVGSWPGAGYRTNFSYLKCANWTMLPIRWARQNCDILIMMFGIKVNLFTYHNHYVTWNISASWKFFFCRSWF